MSFVVSKLVWWLLNPANLFLLLLLVGVVCLWIGRVRIARWLLSALAILAVAGVILPAGEWALAPLEERFPRPALEAPVTGIILLGGAERPVMTAARGTPSVNANADRLFEFARLARRFPDARLVYSGGSGRLFGEAHKEADVAIRILAELGIPPGRLIVDDMARNTAESAVILTRRLAPRAGESWLLVTSARHMPRAIGTFRGAGWPAASLLAAPTDFRTLPSTEPITLQTFSGSLSGLNEAAREWIGLLGYRLTGRTDALFPRPFAPGGANGRGKVPEDSP